MLVDSHCHLDRLEQTPEQLQETIRFAQGRGIEHFLCVSVSVREFQQMLNTVEAYDCVSVSCGVHPLHQEDACSYEELLEAAKHKRVVAIGETGLDYFYSNETKAVQQTSFIDHIRAANTLNKPLIIHTRDARQDTLDLLKQHKAESTNGVLHCFTESWEMAKAAIDMGFYISISGIITFNSANELRSVVKQVPLDRLLVETDSPWLAPVPHRGKQNQPGYVLEVAEYIAKLKGVSFPELAEITTRNFYRLFPLAKAITP
ncbi:TatD family hydrolase [Alteromonas sp. a30]|uniref:TatD family hydrolase n=1 Tax=Alteromonas sp. a30 TaxID=2730917 RepID=UPI00227FEC83|nr:YchF/TatD family DNA exonuclease [Alteromonas sp. a30]MCY7294056.1 YchF/TatD family DNA exonuclease [Alteromonas sp. a30]